MRFRKARDVSFPYTVRWAIAVTVTECVDDEVKGQGFADASNLTTRELLRFEQ